MKAPCSHPCGSCPYRQDVPSGVWDRSEYEKLIEYDKETGEQPPSVFLCHQQNGHICSGWAGCHDMIDSLGLRLASMTMDRDELDETLDYVSPVPLWASGQEAHDHGVAEIGNPGEKAGKVIDKLERRKANGTEREAAIEDR